MPSAYWMSGIGPNPTSLGGGRAEEAGNPAIAFCHSERSRGISKYFWRMVSDVSTQLDTRGVQLDKKRLVHCGDGSSASCTILQTIWHSACTHPCHSERSRGISNYLAMARDYNFWVYIVTNEHDRVLYVGMTNDLERRITEHRAGEIPGFAADYRCGKLVYYEHCTNVLDAIAR